MGALLKPNLNHDNFDQIFSLMWLSLLCGCLFASFEIHIKVVLLFGSHVMP